MDFWESFGVFMAGDGGLGAEKLKSWKAEKLNSWNSGKLEFVIFSFDPPG